LDLTNDTVLRGLYCRNNLLKDLDVFNNVALSMFYFTDNQFTIASMSFKHTECWTYRYAPQYPIPILKIIRTGEELDLSDQLEVDESISTYIWKTQSGAILI
jgi:hypothetical protein